MGKIVILLILAITVNSYGGDPKYPAASIPDSLKKDANAVIRDHRVAFRILSKSSASLYVYRAVTILNEKGKDFATEVIGYDKLSKVTSFSGSLYDAAGVLVKKAKNNQIIDQSAYDGFTLYSDNRVKAIELTHSSYPYTVEFEFTIDYKYLFDIPDYYILPDEKVSLEKGSLILEYPVELAPRYKLINASPQPVRRQAESKEILEWTFKNTSAVLFEPFGSAFFLLPKIMVSPGAFKYDDYEGAMNSWDDFGRWISSLNKGRNDVPEPTKQHLKKITSGLTTREEKVKVIYEFLQNKTRYVGIQLGIGGYQPFQASVVDQTGYGDCKALSNYMVSMLEAVGVKSHYTLIYSDHNPRPLYADFPSSQFNHAIVAVPNDQDTLWLECTSQTTPFGYMGRSTSDRKALLITDDGATLVNTIQYTAGQNKQSRTAEVHLDAAGNARASVKTTYAGTQYENNRLVSVLNGQYDEQKKWLHNNIDVPAFDITSFSFVNRKEKVPSAVVSVEMSLNKYATANGKRMFLTPNLMNRSSYVPEKLEHRQTPVTRRFTYTDLDTIRYHLPEGIYPEFIPEPVNISSRFGEYESDFKVEEGVFIYTRRVKMNKGEFKPESYNELIDFYRGINKADNVKIVFLSKT